ncbi:uridine kinase activity [Suhomyces tanzawaensis NRRL Y-17324]|uniref:Uridine kinase activity n=1 Tax=Suhomyces tanzawaensis NRRL Y-17324 TaxID=984487 RepID=A0A1E4SKG0_9ASCO|nr:uridine kinase activity [Suhomyces tanzawaensis NRRL Y-17324]ODV79980.1 uridine kinase activity [Suhomyces tanzawaensis NRRL Y-17324]
MSAVTLIAFGGPSSSGKTTAAKAVQLVLSHASVLHLDDFYLPDELIPVDPATGELNWDCPEAIDFPKFIAHIKRLKHEGISLELHSIQPGVDMSLTQQQIQALADKADPFKDKPIVLVDGFMLFHDPALLELFDVRLFFHAPFETLKHRRESRKGYNTVAGFWVDPPNYFADVVWPAYLQSHKYLFENGDANAGVNHRVQEQLRFSEFNNVDGTSLLELVDWSLDRIVDHFSS